MASSLLCGVGALAVQALRACGPNEVAAVHSMASGGGVSTEDQQVTGPEREVMMAFSLFLLTSDIILVRFSVICYCTNSPSSFVLTALFLIN
uniref:Uncharacterized protein n=1 Tax=Panthera leo TaxID=9689 RepID=A0A8C8WFZ1_PANLE